MLSSWSPRLRYAARIIREAPPSLLAVLHYRSETGEAQGTRIPYVDLLGEDTRRLVALGLVDKNCASFDDDPKWWAHLMGAKNGQGFLIEFVSVSLPPTMGQNAVILAWLALKYSSAQHATSVLLRRRRVTLMLAPSMA